MKTKYTIGVAFLLVLALAAALVGDPTFEKKWEWQKEKLAPKIINREVQVDPGELLKLMYDDLIKLVILDFRPESSFNIFHITDSRRLDLHDLKGKTLKDLSELAGNAVIVLIDTGEERSTAAWRRLAVAGVPNIYILEEGIRNWLRAYNHEDPLRFSHEPMKYFQSALGGRHNASLPLNAEHHAASHREFTPKVKLQKRVKKSGGCG